MTLFPDGACTEAQRDTMCKGVYLARLDCHQSGVGDVSSMHPMSLTELNTSNAADFTPRQYQLRNRGPKPDMGFGFAFVPTATTHIHKARVMVIDYSKWTLRHFIHFICKFDFLLKWVYFLMYNKLLSILGGLNLISAEFTKNQLTDVSLQRELGWGSHVVNRTCYTQWIALAFRLGMTESYVDHVKTLRQWLEQEGPVASTDRGGYRVPGPSSTRTRKANVAFRDDDDNSRGRSRSRNRDRSPDRSRSRSRGQSLNRGSSGQFQGGKRRRRDY